MCLRHPSSKWVYSILNEACVYDILHPSMGLRHPLSKLGFTSFIQAWVYNILHPSMGLRHPSSKHEFASFIQAWIYNILHPSFGLHPSSKHRFSTSFIQAWRVYNILHPSMGLRHPSSKHGFTTSFIQVWVYILQAWVYILHPSHGFMTSFIQHGFTTSFLCPKARLQVSRGTTRLSALLSLSLSLSLMVDNAVLSFPSPLQFGVPQGSVLGTILFTVYPQPLCDLMCHHECDYHKHADGTQLSMGAPPDQFHSLLCNILACTESHVGWM